MKEIPDIPTTVMANASAELTVLPRGAALSASAPVMNPAVRERWNDYGIGLLLQGDITNAESTFLKVTKMDPKYADGWVNAARARIQQGNMEDAETLLSEALKIDPNLAKTHFFLGTALKALGRYDESIDHLKRAAALYPRDRVVQNQLGRVLFLQRDFTAALEAFQNVLAIDPEDLQAHYNMMLSYQGLGDATAAARERQLYLRFKADEASQAITGPYRRLHPEDNNERQQIHEHESAPLGEDVAAPAAGPIAGGMP
jgi:Tfp pilus assembly protein PilF